MKLSAKFWGIGKFLRWFSSCSGLGADFLEASRLWKELPGYKGRNTKPKDSLLGIGSRKGLGFHFGENFGVLGPRSDRLGTSKIPDEGSFCRKVFGEFCDWNFLEAHSK